VAAAAAAFRRSYSHGGEPLHASSVGDRAASSHAGAGSTQRTQQQALRTAPGGLCDVVAGWSFFVAVAVLPY
jgi:hypothetical protein